MIEKNILLVKDDAWTIFWDWSLHFNWSSTCPQVILTFLQLPGEVDTKVPAKVDAWTALPAKVDREFQDDGTHWWILEKKLHWF